MRLKVGPFFILGKPTKDDVKLLEDDIPRYVVCRLEDNFPSLGVMAQDKHSGKGILETYKYSSTKLCLGKGKKTFGEASSALLHWKHFDFDWAYTNAPPVEANAGVVVIAKSLFLWTLNPLKITAVDKRNRLSWIQNVFSKNATRRTSFTHKTLHGHQISGEEKFSVEWKKSDDSVWYEISTISKPATPIAILAAPLLRFYQQKFVDESVNAMRKLIVPGKKN